MPKPKVSPVIFSAYFDNNHSRYLGTIRLVSVIILFLNNTPVLPYCNKKGALEMSTYESELVVERIGNDIVIALK